MTYKNIQNAHKRAYTKQITFADLLSKRFYHTSKGYTNMIIKDLDYESIAAPIQNGNKWDYSALIEDYISFGFKNYGIFERLVFNGKKWIYIQGQSPAEYNTLRQIFRNRG